MEIKKLKPAFTDERGSIWDLVSDDTINHSGFLISKKNSIRGKHFHKEQPGEALLRPAYVLSNCSASIDNVDRVARRSQHIERKIEGCAPTIILLQTRRSEHEAQSDLDDMLRQVFLRASGVVFLHHIVAVVGDKPEEGTSPHACQAPLVHDLPAQEIDVVRGRLRVVAGTV